MTGGEVYSILYLHDNSITNISGGLLGRTHIELYNSSVLNLSGGTFEDDNWTASINAIDELSRIHLYGYGFTFTGCYPQILVEGYWADHTPFSFILYRTEYPSSNIVLHIIPEPCTLVLIGLGLLLFRGNYKFSLRRNKIY
jgi:hypothetical protein